MEINKSQLEQFARTLQQTEMQYFNNQSSQSSQSKIINPKLNKLNEKKIKLINKLKYDVTALVRLIEEIEQEKNNPSKVKVVGV
jgi:hypothetical protein